LPELYYNLRMMAAGEANIRRAPPAAGARMREHVGRAPDDIRDKTA